MLTQLGSITEDVNHIRTISEKLQFMVDSLEHCLNDLEHHYYASKGVHLPTNDEEKI